jgi:geranylgeranyl diphosphate synthase type II
MSQLTPILVLPRLTPPLVWRQPQETIPPTLAERDRLKAFIRSYVETLGEELTPPLLADELKRHAEAVATAAGIDPKYRDYTGVLLNNEVWRDQLAAVPYDRRLLLLPKCLRIEEKCPAPFDEFGLLCKQCGLCSIQDLQAEAERLGYAVLVAEGSALVMALIQTGKIDAIVGVSCLSVLERAFPYMEAAAIPGVAIPLLQDDCKDTTVDLDWVWDVIHLTSDDHTRRLDLDALRKQVESWFTTESLDEIFGERASGDADALARNWLARAGKRWRPFLTVCAWQALQNDPAAAIPDALRKVAVAVECFHKASLIHDDIEDNDTERYGEQTLHATHGVPVALNAGDLLIGEGYRLLACSGAGPEAIAEMVRIAAAGHRQLCLGQGAELDWQRRRRSLSSLQVLDIHRSKTAPAFEVALRLGATVAGADSAVHGILTRFSESLGIAYQIRDDLEDLESSDDLRKARPSLPMAVAFERANRDGKALLERLWLANSPEISLSAARAILDTTDAPARCRQLFDAYKEQAIRSLPELRNASLKGLLRRVVGKIFTLEVQGWCSEFETRNAAGREAGAESAR